MRLTTAFLLAACLQVSARSFSQQITLSLRDAPLEKVFKEIEKQSDYQFFYKMDLIPRFKNVDVDVKNADLRQTLSLLLKDQSLSYYIVDNTIVITIDHLNDPAAAPGDGGQPPPGLIKGKVVNAEGEPVSGVSVSIKGSSAGTSTDADGNFSIVAKKQDILVFSSIGFQTKEVRIKNNSSIGVISLLPASQRLQDVVIVNNGYQTISKERSAGSFTKPDMSAVANRSTSMDLLQRLDGLVPGLSLNNAPDINSNLAGPPSTMGTPLFPVLLRGLTSINSNTQPLYVVDGIPVSDFSSINPNDVEDITILKDATAASIWGARAANGVIVVTTKKGTTGDKIRVDYDGFLSMQGRPDIGVFPTMNSKQYTQAVSEIMSSPGYTDYNSYGAQMVPSSTSSGYYSAMYPHEFLLYNQLTGSPLNWMPSYYAGKSVNDLASFDNLRQIKDNFYRNAAIMNQTISLRGSVGRYSVYASVSYTDTKDPYPGNLNKTYKLNARQDYNFNKNLQIYLVTDLTNNRTSLARGIYPDSRFLPYAAFKDPQGHPLDMSWLLGNDSVRNNAEQKSVGLRDLGQLNLGYYPLSDMNTGSTKNDDFNERLTAGIKLKIYKGLRFEGLYGAVLNNNQGTSYDDISGFRMQYQLGQLTLPVGGIPPYPGAAPVTQVTPFLPTTGGKYTTNNIQQKSWTIRNQFIYDDSWKNGLHQLTALAGFESQQQTLSYISNTVYGYDQGLLTSKPIDVNSLDGTGLRGSILGQLSGSQYFSQDYLFSSRATDTRFRSWYGNAAYTFMHRYSVNLSSRYDRSNMFGTAPSAQGKPVWSAGVNWLISQEKFMASARFIDRLSIRATYGITGNSPTPPGAANKDILAPGYTNGSLPGGATSPLLINTPANRTLTWEQTQNTNLGLDFSLLGHRLSGSLDYYHKHTTNLISLVPLNTFAGFNFVKGNLGTIDNNGVELRLNSVNVTAGKFTWTSQLNLSYNKGKVVSFKTGTQPVLYASQVLGGGLHYTLPDGGGINFDLSQLGLVAGYQPFNLFAYRYAGLDNVGDPRIRLADGTLTK
ncbi:MAG TPA: SusC/RagA family TonB-linked outer membrane protein, partial [Puia sp.]